MKKIFVYGSISLLIIIIIEIVYLFYLHDSEEDVENRTESKEMSILVGKNIEVSLFPTRPNIPIPSDYDPQDYIMVEGEVYYLQAMNVDDFIYSIRLLQPNGRAHEVLFEDMHKEIISIVKVDPNTQEQVPTTFDDIDLHDNIKIEFFIDLDKQRQNTRSITADRILITIL